MSGIVTSNRIALSALLALCSLFCALPLSRADDGFEKDALSGCSVFKPNLKAGETVLWKGSCGNGSAEGNGMAQWSAKDGSTVTFEGRFAQGKLQGVGRMLASGGDRYEGTYKDGKRDGRGVYISANGDRYEGEYKENQRNGQGLFILAAGGRVAGAWRNGLQVSTEPIVPPQGPAAATPTITEPQLQAQSPDRQSLLEQRGAQEKAARELRDQQRAEQHQRDQLAAQQREEERTQRQQVAQQAAQERQRQTQLAQVAAQEERRQAQLTRQATMDAERRRELLVLWAVLLLPLAAAGLIALSRWNTAVFISNAIADWIGTRRERAVEKTGFFAELFLRPVLWCFHKLVVITAEIESQSIKAAVRIATWIYLVGIILLLIYWVTVIVIAIAILVAGFWILGAILGQGGGSSKTSESTPSRSYAVEGKSREREGLFGDKYTEHTDADGNVVGESREREGIFGDKYVERTDAEANVIGESREREGFFGDKYRVHNDADGNVVGESREREGILGDNYSEHKDSNGNVVGKSRKREGFFGDKYTEHKDQKP